MHVQEMMKTWLANHEEVLHALPRPSPSSGALNTQPSHSLQIWDAELRKMHDAVARAMEHRNELVPISVLPAKLLARIFIHLADIWPVHAYTHGGVDRTGGWSKIVLVCRRWHVVAVQCASLWATVSLDGYEPIDLFLDRTKTVPLHVTGCVHLDKVRELRRLERVLEYCDRFASLDINVTAIQFSLNDADTVILQRLTTMPIIQYLSIGTLGYDPDAVVDQNSGPSCDFVSSLAPQLAVINLRGYIFPWGAGSPSLRSLTSSWRGPAAPLGYTIADVLDSLRAMPALERLELHGCLPDTPWQPSQFLGNQDTVSLPRIKYIQLWSEDEACWVLWASLDIHQASAEISIRSACSSTPQVVTGALSQHIQRPFCPKYTALTLWDNSPYVTVTLADADDTSSIGPKLELDVTLSSDWTDYKLSVLILSTVPIKFLERLSIVGGDYEWSREDLTPLFASAHHLRRIDLNGTSAARAFCSLLLPEGLLNMPTLEHQVITTTDLALPSLSELRMSYVDLRSTLCDKASYSTRLALGEELSIALRIRKAAMIPLSLLSIEYCLLAVDWIPTWTDNVASVECHGHRHYEDEGRTSPWAAGSDISEHRSADASEETQSSFGLGLVFGDPNEGTLSLSDHEDVSEY